MVDHPGAKAGACPGFSRLGAGWCRTLKVRLRYGMRSVTPEKSRRRPSRPMTVRKLCRISEPSADLSICRWLRDYGVAGDALSAGTVVRSQLPREAIVFTHVET